MSARKFSKFLRIGMALALAACSQGCSDADSSMVATNPNSVIVNNGLQLNGEQFNGLQLNGLQLNGLQLNGLQLNGLQLNGTSFSARDAGDASHLLSGTDLSGMTFDVTATLGNTTKQITVKIDSISPDAMSATHDVLLYDLSYQEAGTSTWTSVCTDGNGAALPALPLANRWNLTTGARIDAPDAVTFACSNGALGKCVRWGYRPWATSTRCSGPMCSTVSLQDYHQACTRMVRADYCGNGEAHTIDGTAIDVFDNLSPQVQSRSTNLKLEAKWTANGATCLNKTREAALYPNDKYPDCNNNGKDDDFRKCADRDYALPSPNLIGSSYAN